MTKQQLYSDLAAALARYGQRDKWFADNDLETWYLAREIDDWLTQYRDDPRVSVAQYQRNCERLKRIYLPVEAAQYARKEHL